MSLAGFITWLALCLAIFLFALPSQPGPFAGSGGRPVIPMTITGASFGTPWKYNASYPPQTVGGDGWGTTWADDDKIYIFNCDGSVWNNYGSSRNMGVSTVSSFDTAAVGTMVNQMDPWCCGVTGSDPRSHKIGGIISIGNMLYATNWRLTNNWSTVIGVKDGQIIKSSDHGANWLPQPPSTGAPYAAPMFPGFDVPFGWVQYGRAYADAGPHNSANYVYAQVTIGGSGAGVSPFQNLSQLKLARVPIGSIGTTTDATAWQYWTGGDGMVSGNWSSSVASAAAVLNVTSAAGNGRAGIGAGMQYLPRYGKYVYIATEYPGVPNSIWYVYVCDAPWSCNPAPIATKTWSASESYAFPSMMQKSLVNGGQQMVVTTSGDSSTGASPTGLYTLTYVPMTVSP